MEEIILKKPLIILTGPTAVGKTSLSLALAKAVNGEIISADSMQVYKHMNIGSAKIKNSEMGEIPHHLIDVLEPSEQFNVVKFKQMAEEAMKIIYDNGHIPIITGGTGFYIQALLYDIDFTKNDMQSDYRKELEALYQAHGANYLHDMLEKVDPEAARMIHQNNVKRVIRALEFYQLTNTRISEHNKKEREKTSSYNFLYIVLNDEREKIYQQIDIRVDQMLKAGLIDEVVRLKEMGCTKEMISMQGLGYKEILSYLDGEYTLEEAVYILKRDTRHFAKRQLTWFKRERDVFWLDKFKYEYSECKILDIIMGQLRERKII